MRSMPGSRRTALLVASLVAASLATARPAAADFSDGKVRIGVLTDMAGVYADITGKGSVVATQMAVDDCLADPSCVRQLRRAWKSQDQRRLDRVFANR